MKDPIFGTIVIKTCRNMDVQQKLRIVAEGSIVHLNHRPKVMASATGHFTD
jgi:hypothetical protein